MLRFASFQEDLLGLMREARTPEMRQVANQGRATARIFRDFTPKAYEGKNISTIKDSNRMAQPLRKEPAHASAHCRRVGGCLAKATSRTEAGHRQVHG